MVNSPRRIASLLIPLVFLGTAACSPTTLKVEGHLVWADDGKPVSGASVLFKPVSGTAEANGFTDKDGAFTLMTNSGPGIAAGDYKVIVTKAATAGAYKGGEAKTPEEMAKAMKGTFEVSKTQKVVDPIPEIYGKEGTTPLNFKVDSGNLKPELKINRK